MALSCSISQRDTVAAGLSEALSHMAIHWVWLPGVLFRVLWGQGRPQAAGTLKKTKKYHPSSPLGPSSNWGGKKGYVGWGRNTPLRLMIGKNRKKGCAPCRTEPDLKKKGPRMVWFLIVKSKIRLRHLWGSGREEVGWGQECSTHVAILTHKETSGMGKKCTQLTDGKSAVIS